MVEMQSTPAQESQPHDHKRRRRLLTWLAVGMFAAAAAVLIWWFIWGQYEEGTEDAYVGGNMVMLTPQVPGIVTSVNTDNTYLVSKGDVLVELDTTDPLLAFEASKSQLAETIRDVINMFETAVEYRQEIDVRRAELVKAQDDYQNRIRLVGLGGVSKEEFEHVKADFFAAIGQLEASKARYKAAWALVQSTTVYDHPLVEQAKDKLKEMYVALRRCKIQAPTRGIVAQRSVQIGQSVSQEDPLLAVIPLDEIWVDANYKETHLKHVRIGQSVRLRADLYGRSVIYHGKVIGIAGGTGSVFSILPPQNATGNWIKIVQRLPVRIALDPEQVEEHPLRLGLSMHVKIDTHNRSGPVIPKLKEVRPIYQTDIYAKQIEGVDSIIQTIFSENIPSGFSQDSYTALAEDG